MNDRISPRAGLYVHIPFCQSICPYCDFYSIVGNDDQMDAFLESLSREIFNRKEIYAKYGFNTVYLGGGTPSRLGSYQVGRILDAIESAFDISADTEFSIECNPSSVDREKFGELKHLGINRVSLGIQSFRDANLKILGRIHDSRKARKSFDAARDAGFDNINIDLIYGIPGQTPRQWETDLISALELGPDHISAYNLIIEQNTVFGDLYRKGQLNLPPDDDQRDMYYILSELIEKYGLERYELSNFSRPEKSCRHNLKYWHGLPYLGLGPSAVSFDGSVRSKNIADLRRYIDLNSSGETAFESEEIVDRDKAIEERIMMGMRLSEGLSLILLKEEFAYDLYAEKKQPIDSLIAQGYLEIEGDRMRITKEGLFISDEVTVKLL